MKVRDVMTRDVHIARPGDTLREVSERMARGDFGFIPVAEGDRLIGTITDRDIVVSGLAAGRDPSSTTAGDLASGEVHWVRPEQRSTAFGLVLLWVCYKL